MSYNKDIVPYKKAASSFARSAFNAAVASELPIPPRLLSAAEKLAGRAVKKGWRRYKQRRRDRAEAQAHMGRPIGRGECKTHKSQNSTGSANTRTLYSFGLINLEKKTSGEELFKRDRDVVNFSGVKLCIQGRNTSTGNRCNWNVALVKNKDTGFAPSATSFFRDATNNDRGVNLGTNLTSLELECLPINTDLYHVYWHKRFTLGPDSSADALHSYKKIMTYVPINRQLRFASGGNAPLSGNIYVVYWCDVPFSPAATGIITGQMDVEYMTIQYFREVN